MSGLDRIINGIKEVLRMSDEIKRVSEALKLLAIEVRDIDKRLIRIETFAEVAKAQGGRGAGKRLPKATD